MFASLIMGALIVACAFFLLAIYLHTQSLFLMAKEEEHRVATQDSLLHRAWAVIFLNVAILSLSISFLLTKIGWWRVLIFLFIFIFSLRSIKRETPIAKMVFKRN